MPKKSESITSTNTDTRIGMKKSGSNNNTDRKHNTYSLLSEEDNKGGKVLTSRGGSMVRCKTVNNDVDMSNGIIAYGENKKQPKANGKVMEGKRGAVTRKDAKKRNEKDEEPKKLNIPNTRLPRLENSTLLEKTMELSSSIGEVMISKMFAPSIEENGSGESYSVDDVTDNFSRLVDTYGQVAKAIPAVEPSETSTSEIDALNRCLAYVSCIRDIFETLKPILLSISQIDTKKANDKLLEKIDYIANLVGRLVVVADHESKRLEWTNGANVVFTAILDLLEIASEECEAIHQGRPSHTKKWKLSSKLEKALIASGHLDELEWLTGDMETKYFESIVADIVRMHYAFLETSPAAIPLSAATIMDLDHENIPTIANVHSLVDSYVARFKDVSLPREKEIAKIIREIVPRPVGTEQVYNANAESTSNKCSAVSVYGAEGIGKTAIAALLICKEQIRRYFNGGIVWLHIGQVRHERGAYVYDFFCKCLKNICDQLDIQAPVFKKIFFSPRDDNNTVERKEKLHMKVATQTVCEMLKGRRILLVLDDVWDKQCIEWFQFESNYQGPFVQVLVTTRFPNLSGTKAVQAKKLDKTEALELLKNESKISGDIFTELTSETNSDDVFASLLQRTNVLNHRTTLVVSAEGRLLRMIQSPFYGCNGSALSSPLPAKKEQQINKSALFGILNHILSPDLHGDDASNAIKLCFAAFATLFSSYDEYRPWIPTDTANLLWGKLIREFDTGKGIKVADQTYLSTSKKLTEVINDIFVDSGLMDELCDPNDNAKRNFLRIHHDEYKRYGDHLAAYDELINKVKQNWDLAFIIEIEKRKNKHVWSQKNADTTHYALKMLPWHMFKAGMLDKAVALLKDMNFIQERFTTIGELEGTLLHISDCEELLRHAGKGESYISMQEAVMSICQKVAVCLRQNSLSREKKKENPSFDRSQALHEIGVFLANQGLTDEAMKHLEEAVTVKGTVYGNDSVEVADTLNVIAEVFHDRGEKKHAIWYFEKVISLMEKSIDNNAIVANSLFHLGRIFEETGNKTHAHKYYEKALQTYQSASGNYRLEVADLFFHVGNIEFQLCEYVKSIYHHNNALRIREKECGKDHLDVAHSLHGLGTVYEKLNKHEDAIECYTRALEIRRKKLGNCHMEVSSLLFNIGLVYIKLSQHKKAMKNFEEVLRIRRTLLGDKHEKVAEVLFGIGTTYFEIGKRKICLDSWKEALKIQRKTLGNHVDVASTLYFMGLVHNLEGHHVQALMYLEEALKAYRALGYSDEKPRVTSILENITKLRRKPGCH